MNRIKPRIFVSYSRKDADFIQGVRGALAKAGIECWIDVSAIEAGDRLREAILGDGIPNCNLFFAYLTRDYLNSDWCMRELGEALQSARVRIAPFAESTETLSSFPLEVRRELHCGILDATNYWDVMMQVSGKAWMTPRRRAFGFL
jgi:hypothetical protein